MGTRRRKLPLALIVGLLLSISGVGGVAANHEGNPALNHIDINFPITYGSCVDAVTSDDISITNVHAPGDPGTRWRLLGQIIIQYVTDEGRVQVPGGFIAIDQDYDLYMTIEYPPVSEWPVQSNGTAEIHVDIQLEVLDENNNYVGGIGLGPGHDWDVYCLTPPPPDDPGAAGCTPGYWKNHLTAWADTGYAPDDSFSTVFGVVATGNPTLEQALNEGGGDESALMRHATAALLNAASPGVDYAYSVAEIIQMVQAAYASGDFESAKNSLELENERGCTLEGFQNTTGGGPPDGVGAKIKVNGKK